MRRGLNPGFTLVELLVVIAVIGILAALILGAASAARFRSQVAQCSNNFRQWGIAINLHAADDGKGRLPAFSLPLAKFKGYRDLHLWFVSLQMATNLAPFGVSIPVWFCPAGRSHSLSDFQQFVDSNFPGKTPTPDDLTAYWLARFKFFAGINYNWLIPRPLEGTSEVYPDPKLVTSRIPDGWPTRIDDPAGAIQPIMTDIIWCPWNETRTALDFGGMGHEFPRVYTRNINLLFLDGHVETRGRKVLEWQFEMSGGAVIPY